MTGLLEKDMRVLIAYYTCEPTGAEHWPAAPRAERSAALTRAGEAQGNLKRRNSFK